MFNATALIHLVQDTENAVNASHIIEDAMKYLVVCFQKLGKEPMTVP